MAVFYRSIAPYYDDDYADFHHGEDIRFYHELARKSPGPVLEMGCGTGRILLPLARAGVNIWGIDLSLPILARLSSALHLECAAVRERVTIVHGDIRKYDPVCRFPLVIAAGNVLNTFVDRNDQRAFLRSARRSLAPGGAFCFDVFQPDYARLLLPEDEWIPQFDRVERETGNRVRRFYRCEQEREFQRFCVTFRWVVEDQSGRQLSERSASIMQRWFVRGELENLLEMEGFQITDYWGNFKGEPFGKGATEQIIRAVAS